MLGLFGQRDKLSAETDDTESVIAAVGGGGAEEEEATLGQVALLERLESALWNRLEQRMQENGDGEAEQEEEEKEQQEEEEEEEEEEAEDRKSVV